MHSICTLLSEWPLEENEERQIMLAVSQATTPISEEDEEFGSPASTYFSDKKLLHLDHQMRQHSISSTSLRCSICQRRFHSIGNLSNHNQLYH
jgi:hypothetical protein